jgi:methylenetetrahydrofolate reductase (NADPH)
VSCLCYVELLTPKQSSADLDADLESFAAKFHRILDGGCAVSIPDNPLGVVHFQAMETLPELGLQAPPERLMVHVNTFHTRESLDNTLTAAERAGVRQLLVVTGDGGERLPKLSPAALGAAGNSVTSVELLRYIRSRFPGVFTLGVAYNQYEPPDHELEKMRRKIAAGAEFICTQPVIGRDERALAARQFGVPVILDAWMSRKLHLLSRCVGYEIREDTPYDPVENFRTLRRSCGDCGIYLALFNFKTQDWLLRELGTHRP